MKIPYDLRENFWNYYNEVLGIMINRKKVGNHKPMQYKTILVLYFVLYVLLSYEYYFIFKNDSSTFAVFFDNFYMIFNYLFIILTTFQILIYIYIKRNAPSGQLIMDEYGITNEIEKQGRYGMPWHRIKALIITQNTCTFITYTFIFFSVPRSLVPKIMLAIRKYKKDLDIISYAD